jgi:hypothetical protein
MEDPPAERRHDPAIRDEDGLSLLKLARELPHAALPQFPRTETRGEGMGHGTPGPRREPTYRPLDPDGDLLFGRRPVNPDAQPRLSSAVPDDHARHGSERPQEKRHLALDRRNQPRRTQARRSHGIVQREPVVPLERHADLVGLAEIPLA